MKLFRIFFKLGKHEKQIDKGGTSVEDAFGKVEVDYRLAAKRPELVRAEILQDYGQVVFTPGFGSEHEASCDALRERVVREEGL